MIFRFLKILFILSIGFLLHQLPQYNNLYVHVLKGVFYEAKKTVLEHRKAAIQSKKSLREYVSKHLNHSDSDFQNTGKTMIRQIQRHQKYVKLLKKLKEAHPLVRHLLLLYHYEYAILQQVDFKPGLLFTHVGGFYSIFGCLIGFSILLIVSQARKLRFAFRKGA